MIRRFHSEDYNLHFDTVTGFMARWGRTKEEDPAMCPMGPEIADIEISTICNGIGKSMDKRKPCTWCYKSNTGEGEFMRLETFKTIFAKFPKTLTQIAFGIGDIDAQPFSMHMWKIMEHCREHGVVPNVTTNGMGVKTDIAKRLANTCGAVAVSHYHIDDVCFDAIDKLTKAGLSAKVRVRRKKK